jgi:hypothetical protein
MARRVQLALVAVSDCAEVEPATAVAVIEREVVGVVVVVVTAVPLVPVVVGVVAALLEAVLPVAAMQPVSRIMPATLTVPARLRARWAGCGRRRRGAGGDAVRMLAPFGRT